MGCGDGCARRYSLACPTVAASGKVTVAVQHAGDHIVACDARQNRDRVDQLSRCLCTALTATTARQAQFGMHAALPMKREDEFCLRAVDVDQDFFR